MDIRSDGRLSVTTVFAKTTRARRFKAVYTHTVYDQYTLPNNLAQPDVSQRYGECEIAR